MFSILSFFFFLTVVSSVLTTPSNFSINQANVDFSTMTYTQLTNEKTVFIGLRSDGKHLFTSLDSMGNISQIAKALSGSRTFQRIHKLQNGGFVFIWAEQPSSGLYALHFQIYDDNLTELYPSVQYHTGQNSYSFNEIIDLANGGFALYYYDPGSPYYKFYWQMYDSQGNVTMQQTLIGSGADPYGLRLKSGNLFLMYGGASAEQLIIFDPNSTVIKAGSVIFSNKNDNQMRFHMGACAMTSGKVILVNTWTSTVNNDGFYTIFDPNGTILVDRIKISANNIVTVFPRCACLNNGNAVVAWGITNSSGLYSYYFMVINDSGNKISAENYIFDSGNKTGIFLESFSDNSFFVGVAGYPPNIINVQFFNANLQKIFTANTCLSPKIISADKTVCFDPINNCSSYFNNGTCELCVSPFEVTIGKISCALRISNCSTYYDDGKCLTCNISSILTIGKLACVQEITNCSSYLDDGKCNSCSNETNLTIGRLACANPIANCGNYSDDTTCQTCSNGKTLSVKNLFCATNISLCSSYSDFDGVCLNCIFPNVLTENRLACAQPIANCTVYFDNATCKTCNGTSVLSNSGLECLNIISHCVQYSSNGGCQQCDNITHLTISNNVCAATITDCGAYSDDQKCLSCLDSKILTEGHLNCTPSISNCQSYSDSNGLCNICNLSYILTESNISCSSPISNCLIYFDNKTCRSCNSSKILSDDGLNCLNSIQDCLNYSKNGNDEGKCLSCGNGKKLTRNQTSCVSAVENCLSYDENGKCLKCSMFFVLTPNNTCKPEITDCTDYNNAGLCTICKNPKIPSMNKTAVSPPF